MICLTVTKGAGTIQHAKAYWTKYAGIIEHANKARIELPLAFLLWSALWSTPQQLCGWHWQGHISTKKAGNIGDHISMSSLKVVYVYL